MKDEHDKNDPTWVCGSGEKWWVRLPWVCGSGTGSKKSRKQEKRPNVGMRFGGSERGLTRDETTREQRLDPRMLIWFEQFAENCDDI